ncbi:MAG: hypothetical protein ABIL37_04140 [candidate division WOR-3 bacterium]
MLTLLIISNFPSNVKVEQIEGVELDPKLGNKIENIYFYDQNGNFLNFSSLIDYKTPIILIPVYYTCDVVCNSTLFYTFEQLKNLSDLKIGKDYKIVAFSFDYKNTLQDAKSKSEYCKLLNSNSENCKFLFSDSSNINKMLNFLGIKIRRISKDEISHPVTVIILTPSGRISNYLYGLSFLGIDLRLSIYNAQVEKIRDISDLAKSALLFCFHYDPKGGKYAFQFTKVAGIIGISMLILVFIIVKLYKSNRANEHQLNV